MKDILEDIIKIIYNTISLYTNTDNSGRPYKQICNHISLSITRTNSGVWGCVMGHSFSSFLPAYNGSYITFKLPHHELLHLFHM